MKCFQVVALIFLTGLGACTVATPPALTTSLAATTICGPNGGDYPPSEPAAYLRQPEGRRPFQWLLLIEAPTGRAHLYAYNGHEDHGWSPNLCMQMDPRVFTPLPQAAVVGRVQRVGLGNNPWLEVRSTAPGWSDYRIGSSSDTDPRTAFVLSERGLQILERRMVGFRSGGLRAEEIAVIILGRFERSGS